RWPRCSFLFYREQSTVDSSHSRWKQKRNTESSEAGAQRSPRSSSGPVVRITRGERVARGEWEEGGLPTGFPRSSGQAGERAYSDSGRSPPYSLSLLWSVFKLIPRSSAARVLLFPVALSVWRMSSRSMASTVVPTGNLMVDRSLGPFAAILPNSGGR